MTSWKSISKGKHNGFLPFRLHRQAPCFKYVRLAAAGGRLLQNRLPAAAARTFSRVPSKALPHSQQLYGALPQPGRARENFGKRCDSLAAFATTLGNDATTPWGGVGEG